MLTPRRVAALLAVSLAVAAVVPPVSAAPDVRRMLASADLDGDGMITRAEFLAQRSQLFTRLDRNRDGVIDRSDRPAMRLSAARIDRAAAAMDKNGDGQVTRTEFEDAPIPLFDRADLDGNGVIDGFEMSRLPRK